MLKLDAPYLLFSRNSRARSMRCFSSNIVLWMLACFCLSSSYNIFLRSLFKSGFWETETKAVQSNCTLSWSYTALASVVLPNPPKPTIDTTLCCCADMSSPFVNLVISSSLASSMPTRSVALVYSAVMRGSTNVLAGLIASTLYLSKKRKENRW